MICPVCSKIVEDFHRVWSEKPFTAKEALPGLAAWGGYGVERTILCENTQFIHFKFDHNDSERLVEMVPDLPERRRVVRDHYENMKHECEHEGCEAEGWPGWSVWGEEEPLGWVCDDHAYEHGFCPICHCFLAGIESFDFSEHGMCEDCWDQFANEFDDDEEEEMAQVSPDATPKTIEALTAMANAAREAIKRGEL